MEFKVFKSMKRTKLFTEAIEPDSFAERHFFLEGDLKRQDLEAFKLCRCFANLGDKCSNSRSSLDSNLYHWSRNWESSRRGKLCCLGRAANACSGYSEEGNVLSFLLKNHVHGFYSEMSMSVSVDTNFKLIRMKAENYCEKTLDWVGNAKTELDYMTSFIRCGVWGSILKRPVNLFKNSKAFVEYVNGIRIKITRKHCICMKERTYGIFNKGINSLERNTKMPQRSETFEQKSHF